MMPAPRDRGLTRYAQSHLVLPVRLFMSDTESEVGVESMRRFQNALARRFHEGLTVTRVFDGESHTSTIPVALTRVLQVVFVENRRAAR